MHAHLQCVARHAFDAHGRRTRCVPPCYPVRRKVMGIIGLLVTLILIIILLRLL